MKKYTIELSEDQLRLVANCLEDVSRFAAGQCELRYTVEMMLHNSDITFDESIKRRDEVDLLMKQIKRTLLPELSENASLSYNTTPFIGNVYQIYRTILHRLAVDNNWNNVYSSPALPSGDMGEVVVSELKTTTLKKCDEEWIDETACCRVGPITSENYCPQCGSKIIRE